MEKLEFSIPGKPSVELPNISTRRWWWKVLTDKLEVAELAAHLGGQLGEKFDELGLWQQAPIFYQKDGDQKLLVASTVPDYPYYSRRTRRITVNKQERDFETPGLIGHERYTIADYHIHTRQPYVTSSTKTLWFEAADERRATEDCPPLILRTTDHYYNLFPGEGYAPDSSQWNKSHAVPELRRYIDAASDILTVLADMEPINRLTHGQLRPEA